LTTKAGNPFPLRGLIYQPPPPMYRAGQAKGDVPIHRWRWLINQTSIRSRDSRIRWSKFVRYYLDLLITGTRELLGYEPRDDAFEIFGDDLQE